MIRKIFSVFLDSYAESLKLKESYRRLTTRLGWLTVAAGCLLLVLIMYQTRLLFGLPLEGGSLEGLRVNLVAWVISTIVLVPLAFYAGMILIYGAAGLIMFALGRLGWRQAVKLGARARYPKEWYRSNS